jgi:hypothetical protein
MAKHLSGSIENGALKQSVMDDLAEAEPFFNGSALDDPLFSVTESAGTVYANLEANGGGDVRFLFSDGVHTHDCTPIAQVALTVGTDAAPTLNYVYILQSSKALVASTAGWPTTEHAPVGVVYAQSAASIATDGPIIDWAWTDHVQNSNNQGHLSNINRWIRSQNATWADGVALTPTAGAAQLDVATTAGNVLQLHPHAYPAFDTSTGSEIYVMNDPDAALTTVAGLTIAQGVDKDANGDTLGAAGTDFYNLVIWGVVSENSSECKLMCNVPDGAYANNTGDQAENDDNKTAIYSIPSEFRGTGFLIARLTVQVSGTTYTVLKNTDLRGQLPTQDAGGGNPASIPKFWYLITLGNTTDDISIGVKDDIPMPAPGKIYDVGAMTKDAVVGTDSVIDLHLNGVTALTDKITIEAGDDSSLDAATQPTLITNPTAFAAGDNLAPEVDTASTSGGAGAKLAVLISWD